MSELSERGTVVHCVQLQLNMQNCGVQLSLGVRDCVCVGGGDKLRSSVIINLHDGLREKLFQKKKGAIHLCLLLPDVVEHASQDCL